MLNPTHFTIANVGWEILKGVYDGKPYPIFWFYAGPSPNFLPWDKFLDDRTNRFSIGKPLDGDSLKETIKHVRNKVGQEYLFPAIFSEQDLGAGEKEKLQRLRAVKVNVEPSVTPT